MMTASCRLGRPAIRLARFELLIRLLHSMNVLSSISKVRLPSVDLDSSEVASDSITHDPSVDLSAYNNAAFDAGRGQFVRLLWFLLGAPLLRCTWIPSNLLRVTILRVFGAKLGRGVVVKPGVRVKFPWRLSVGEHSWIGEDAWLDNLCELRIGDSCCVSQGVYLCTGSHDWEDPRFGVITKPITLEDGCWVGARAVVLPGSTVGNHSVLTSGSVASGNLSPFIVYRGNPAKPVVERVLRRDSIT